MSLDYWTKKVAEIRHRAKTETALPDTIQDMGLLLNNIDCIIEAIKALIEEYWKSLDAPAWAFFTLAHIESKLQQYKQQIPSLFQAKLDKESAGMDSAIDRIAKPEVHSSPAAIQSINSAEETPPPAPQDNNWADKFIINSTNESGPEPDPLRDEANKDFEATNNLVNNLATSQAADDTIEDVSSLAKSNNYSGPELDDHNDGSNNFPAAGSQAKVVSSHAPGTANGSVNHGGARVSATCTDCATGRDKGQKKDGAVDNKSATDKSASAKQDGRNVVDVKTKISFNRCGAGNNETVTNSPKPTDVVQTTISRLTFFQSYSSHRTLGDVTRNGTSLPPTLTKKCDADEDVKIMYQASNIGLPFTTPKLGIG